MVNAVPEAVLPVQGIRPSACTSRCPAESRCDTRLADSVQLVLGMRYELVAQNVDAPAGPHVRTSAVASVAEPKIAVRKSFLNTIPPEGDAVDRCRPSLRRMRRAESRGCALPHDPNVLVGTQHFTLATGIPSRSAAVDDVFGAATSHRVGKPRSSTSRVCPPTSRKAAMRE